MYQFNAQQAANQAQALDQQRQMTFDTYLDRMSDLIFLDGLATSKPGSEVRAMAVRTFAPQRLRHRREVLQSCFSHTLPQV